MIKPFVDLLNQSLSIHEKKNKDYASAGNEFENFERSALVSSWFNKPIDKVFITLITTKLTRLATLLNKSTEPNNESIEDSFLDLVTYCGLWGANYIHSKIVNEAIPFLLEHHYMYFTKEKLWRREPGHMMFYMSPAGEFASTFEEIKRIVLSREELEKTNAISSR